MCVYIYIYIYVYMYILCVCVYIYIYIHTHTYIYGGAEPWTQRHSKWSENQICSLSPPPTSIATHLPPVCRLHSSHPPPTTLSFAPLAPLPVHPRRHPPSPCLESSNEHRPLILPTATLLNPPPPT